MVGGTIQLLCLEQCSSNQEQEQLCTFDKPYDAAGWLTQFVAVDFTLIIDGREYPWPERFHLILPTSPRHLKLHEEVDMILAHIMWCLDINEAFYQD